MRVIQMVADSLRYWAQEMHVDGFRFDLGTILAREPNGFDNQSGFLKAVTQDPVLGKLKLIAEPWDCGPGGYQVGGFPPGWAEWNDQYRDAVRGYWNGSAPAGALAPRLCASADVFNRLGRLPWSSVNFVTAHDGFTLADLVSYNDKHNEANGEENRDGTSDNRSWNCGAEGPTEDAAILALRARQSRNFLATLLLSQGTPMMLAGDEFGRTQLGNNNAYCQDNQISWLDWTHTLAGAALQQFVRQLTGLRARFPILHRRRFLTGRFDEEFGIRDVTWIHPSGKEMQQEDWTAEARCFGMLMDGRSQAHGLHERGTDATLLLVFNSHHEPANFALPDCSGARAWALQFDTATEQGPAPREFQVGESFQVSDRCLLLFELLTETA
jgi:glycogen operon protein